jgi:glycosyltransferase involved in cell wall biosynthesis
MRAASGTRLKILQALAMRRPVVSTGIGAEGLGLEANSHLLVAPVVEAFAEALIHLLTHPARQAALVRAGRAIIWRHAWEKLLPALDVLYPRSL